MYSPREPKIVGKAVVDGSFWRICHIDTGFLGCAENPWHNVLEMVAKATAMMPVDIIIVQMYRCLRPPAGFGSTIRGAVL